LNVTKRHRNLIHYDKSSKSLMLVFKLNYIKCEKNVRFTTLVGLGFSKQIVCENN
jgi:hypothetical protein